MLNPIHFKQCEDVIRRHSSSFYQAFRVLPSPKKEAVYVIYAFCRLIDDAVDEPETSPFTLNELREAFKNLDEAKGHFIWPALRWLFEAFPMSKSPFLTQMDGQERDLIDTHYEKMNDLEKYCYQVAGTVGEMLLPVLQETPNSVAPEAGVKLGKAMQLVNIIRDVGEDQARGRRYLPLDLMHQYGYTVRSFEEREVNAPFKKMIDALTKQADQWFKEGLDGLAALPIQSRLGVELAACYYRTIIDVIIQTNHYRVFEERAFVSDTMKQTLFSKVAHNLFEAEAEAKEGLAFL